MRCRITEFAELKAYVDIFNERGHPGFREPIDPFFWWNHGEPGKVDNSVKAFIEDGLVVILETEADTVKNLLVFSLSQKKKETLNIILDITKNYGTVIYNSEYHDRYRYISRRFDGSSWFSNNRHYYGANGRKAWKQSVRQ